MDEKVERKLRQVAEWLKHLQPETEVDEVLSHLNEVENHLEMVRTSSSESMRMRFSGSMMEALVTKPLVNHKNSDVHVMVASCMIKILKITAPNHPFQENLMKEALMFIVSSFMSLSRYPNAPQSYQKSVLILEAVAEDDIWGIMLKFGCHDLIRGMFLHLMGSIRDYHSDSVFESMAKIMSGVLMSSEDISRELLNPILAILKRDMKEFQPIAQKLGECVFRKCATKLKPYLKSLVEESALPLDDYSEIVTIICKMSDSEGHDDGNASGVHLETSCTMKGKMLMGRGTSTICCEDRSDEEKEFTRSGKMTSGCRGQPLKKSGKMDVLETMLSNTKHETTNEEGDKSNSPEDGDGRSLEAKAEVPVGKEKTSRSMVQHLKKSGKSSVSEAKLLGKKVDETNMDKDISKKDISERSVCVKKIKEKVLSQSDAKDDGQGMIILRKSRLKPFKDNDPIESSKRKRTRGNNKVSGEREYGEKLIGAKVKVWWPHDKQYYEGIIESFDCKRNMHKVLYTDGDEESLVLKAERWEFVDDRTMEEEVIEDPSPKSKKAKTDPEQLKQKELDVSSPKSGEAGKSEGTATESGGQKTAETAEVKSSKAGKSGGRSVLKRRRGSLG